MRLTTFYRYGGVHAVCGECNRGDPDDVWTTDDPARCRLCRETLPEMDEAEFASLIADRADRARNAWAVFLRDAKRDGPKADLPLNWLDLRDLDERVETCLTCFPEVSETACARLMRWEAFRERTPIGKRGVVWWSPHVRAEHVGTHGAVYVRRLPGHPHGAHVALHRYANAVMYASDAARYDRWPEHDTVCGQCRNAASEKPTIDPRGYCETCAAVHDGRRYLMTPRLRREAVAR